jgi:superkiller protein 3
LDGGAFVAERFLLFPLALIVLGGAPLAGPLAAWLTKAWSRLPWNGPSARFPVYVLPLLWLLASAITVQLVLPNWRDDLSLWAWGSRRAPLSPTPPINLGLAYANLGAADQAIAESNRALQLAPQEGNAWNNLGMGLFYKGEFESAQQAFLEAVRLEPENAVYWNNLAATYREQGQLEEAEKVLLDKALTLDPVLPIGHFNLGMVYKLGGRPDLAVEYLQEALALFPADQGREAQAQLAELEQPAPWLDLGSRFLTGNDPEAALAAYERAEQLGARPIDVVPGASRALIELDALDQAEALIERFIEQAPDDARLYLNLGLIAQKRGELEAAQTLVERAVELAPQWEEPQLLLRALRSQ